MPTRRCGIVAALTLLMASSIAIAQCKWDSEKISVNASPADENCVISFNFKNVGKTPITFKQLTPSCGCTNVDLEKKTFLGGESGTLKATVSLGNSVGTLSKFIAVVVTGGESETTTKLQMDIDIQTPLKISPAAVSWHRGDSPTPKTIHLKTNGSTPIHIASIESSYASIHTSVRTVKDGQEYELELTPTDTSKTIEDNLVIHTDFKPNGNEKRFELWASIEPK